MPDKRLEAKASREVRAELSYGYKGDSITVVVVPEGQLPANKVDKQIACWLNYAAASTGLGRVIRSVGAVSDVTDDGIVVDVERSRVHRLARSPYVRKLEALRF